MCASTLSIHNNHMNIFEPRDSYKISVLSSRKFLDDSKYSWPGFGINVIKEGYINSVLPVISIPRRFKFLKLNIKIITARVGDTARYTAIARYMDSSSKSYVTVFVKRFVCIQV